jgi:opacity protein-like surface antigen
LAELLCLKQQLINKFTHKKHTQKNMKKLLLSFALIAGLTYAASAQTEGAVRKLSIGAEFGFPTGSNSDELLVGGTAQFELPVAKSLNITFTTGYLSDQITGDSRDLLKALGIQTSFGFVPIKAGAKYYFGKNFYGAGEVGAIVSTESGGGTAFAFGPTLGTSFSVSDKSSIDLGVRFETWAKNGGNSSFLGLRAAFAFGL